MTKPTQRDIADLLDRIGDLLEAQEENPHRVRAYHSAADTIARAAEPVAEWAAAGDRAALTSLPGIGEGLAALITDYAKEGYSDLLRQLEEQAVPGSMLVQVPGIGPTLAARIHEALGIDTLEELELAAHDGRLDSVEGIGRERVKAVRASLAGMLSDSARRRARQRTAPAANDQERDEPSVAMLLDIDAEYRRRAADGNLPTIAPRRFNPEGKAWLPLLETKRGPWRFTALFSNTARAHEAGKTDDWVVIYFERDGTQERQRTVVTETRGERAGERVVRGREN